MGGKDMFYQFVCCGCKKKKKNTTEENRIVSWMENGDDTDIIKSIYLCIEKNGKEHHTWKYSHMRKGDGSNLVIRRGQTFRIEILLKCCYNPDDVIHFTFRCSDTATPNFRNGSLVVVGISKCDESNYSWKATLQSHENNVLKVDITPSPDCIISKWDMQVSYKQKGKTALFKLNRKVYILFNPWCESDQVYMKSNEWREEAVLNAEGMIWCSKTRLGRSWNYAQFDGDILDCALDLFANLGRLKIEMRSNPIDIARKLSAMVNVNDGDGGVLAGKWNGSYEDGTSPNAWTGSRDILQQFYRKKHAVKYGQCWVFAGILTTVCRALGIPSRVVTNFDSAHDGDGSLTIDYYVDSDGKQDTHSDSVWNFHVWSEVWMKRPDLGTDYDGWQVLDATPQEESNGIFRCGPASVAACRNGDIHKPYDVGFVFSEVNADKVCWRIDSNRNCQLIKKITDDIGNFISTKAAGKFERLDLTDTYKFKEHSREERATVLKVMRQVDHHLAKSYVASEFEEVVFKFKYYEDITVGQNFDVALVMANKSNSRAHEVTTTLRLDVFSYTGKHINTIKVKKELVFLQKNTNVEFTMPVVFENYKNYLVDNSHFVISCMATVEKTNWCYYDRDNIQIKKPNVEIDVGNKGKVGKEIQGVVTIQNPLPVTINKGEFLIEAPGIGKQMKIALKKNILPGQKITENFTFTPQMPGLQTVAAKFVSQQLEGVEGFLQVLIDI